MKKIALLSAICLIIASSCLKEGSNYTRFSGYINVDSLSLQDTVILGDTVEINVIGGASNGCWSNLELLLTNPNDSMVLITATGLFESQDGICSNIYQTIDSVFTFKPADTGKIMVYGWSPGDRVISDSLIVLSSNRKVQKKAIN